LESWLLTLLADSSFACLSLLEDEASQLYEVMVQKAEDTQTSLLLDVILQETRKHRELLRHLTRIFEQSLPQSSIECEGQMGQLFMQALTLLRSIKDEDLRGKAIADVAGELVDFEKGASEEYLTELYSRVATIAHTNRAVKKIFVGYCRGRKRTRQNSPARSRNVKEITRFALQITFWN
jgi:rubrerythrin